MKTKIIKDKWGLNGMELELSAGSEHKFEDNYVRKEISKLGIGLGCLYYFFETTLNPEADEAIQESFRSFEHGGASSWHFNASMMKLLLKVIHDESKRASIAHIHFSLVENVGVHDVDVHSEQGYWPIVHILKNATSEQRVDFGRTVECVLEDNWNEIERREAPFNYNIEAFEVLRDKQIRPLLIGNPEILIGYELKKAIDWLLPYQYVAKPEESVSIWDL
jgi:hypothetical protein